MKAFIFISLLLSSCNTLTAESSESPEPDVVDNSKPQPMSFISNDSKYPELEGTWLVAEDTSCTICRTFSADKYKYVPDTFKWSLLVIKNDSIESTHETLFYKYDSAAVVNDGNFKILDTLHSQSTYEGYIGADKFIYPLIPQTWEYIRISEDSIYANQLYYCREGSSTNCTLNGTKPKWSKL